MQLFQRLCRGKKPTDLVFTAPEGGAWRRRMPDALVDGMGHLVAVNWAASSSSGGGREL
ncbi:hypothetical protein [Streptomyces sp. NPDC093600]|uniref:hypothetical protein n=1 Tax=Streptomyces sp. NPDC093600 TaxID=3366047 RepID=UPI00381E3412